VTSADKANIPFLWDQGLRYFIASNTNLEVSNIISHTCKSVLCPVSLA